MGARLARLGVARAPPRPVVLTGGMRGGPAGDAHVAQRRAHGDAGVDEIYVQQIGPDFDGFFTAYEKDVLPALR